MGNSNNGIIAGLVIIVFIFFSLFSHKAKLAEKNEKIADALETTVSKIDKQAKVTELKLSDSLTLKQAEVEILTMTKRNLQAKYDALLKASKIKPKYVNNVTTTTVVTHSVDTVVCEVDSFRGIKAQFKDEYAQISVDIDSLRRAAFDYSIKDSLTIINYEKKHSLLFGLIKWKSYEGCRVITHNPKATPASAVSYNVIK